MPSTPALPEVPKCADPACPGWRIVEPLEADGSGEIARCEACDVYLSDQEVAQMLAARGAVAGEAMHRDGMPLGWYRLENAAPVLKLARQRAAATRRPRLRRRIPPRSWPYDRGQVQFELERNDDPSLLGPEYLLKAICFGDNTLPSVSEGNRITGGELGLPPNLEHYASRDYVVRSYAAPWRDREEVRGLSRDAQVRYRYGLWEPAEIVLAPV